MSAVAQVLTNIERASLELGACEERLRDAAAKLRTAKKARESAPSSLPAKQKLALRHEHEAADEHHAACVRERDAAAQSVRDANAALTVAEQRDRWVAADDALAPCKVVAKQIIALQDQIALLDRGLAPQFRHYLEQTDMVGTQADPMVEHTPGRPRFVSDLLREVRRELGQDVPDIALSTPNGKLLAHLTAAQNAAAQQDRARPQRPKFKEALSQAEQDQLLWCLHTRGPAVPSDLLLERAAVSQDQLWALAGSPLPGSRARADKVDGAAIAEIAAGLPRAINICGARPLPGGAGGPGRPYSPEAVKQLRNDAKGWHAPAPITAPKPDDKWLTRNPEVLAAEEEFYKKTGQFRAEQSHVTRTTEEATK